MEEKKYGFKFNSNKREDTIEKVFKDPNGKVKVSIEGDNNTLNMKEDDYTLGNNPYNLKTSKIRVKKPGNIGPGSTGFIGVAMIAAVVAIAGVVITFLILKF